MIPEETRKRRGRGRKTGKENNSPEGLVTRKGFNFKMAVF